VSAVGGLRRIDEVEDATEDVPEDHESDGERECEQFGTFLLGHVASLAGRDRGEPIRKSATCQDAAFSFTKNRRQETTANWRTAEAVRTANVRNAVVIPVSSKVLPEPWGKTRRLSNVGEGI